MTTVVDAKTTEMINSKQKQFYKKPLLNRTIGKVVVIMSLFLNFSGCTNENIKKLSESVDVEMVDDKYNVVFDRNTDDEWKYLDVDSIAMSDGFGILLYGKSDYKKEKKWFYIGGGERELKKGFGNWDDGEFRKYRLNEIDKDRTLYRALLSTKELWDKIN